MTWYSRQIFQQRTSIRTWLYSGIVFSCAVLPVWSQDADIPDPTTDDYIPLPPAISSEEDAPAPFSDPEINETQLDAAGPDAALTPQQTGFLKQSAIERQRAFMDAVRNSEETLKVGRDSFERGLMPLEDYADLTQAALEIRLTVAGLQNDRAARVNALVNHSELMRSAARQHREFNQPSSTGWEADTAYAELLSANADLRLAAARGDRDAYTTAINRSQEFAETHYDLRLADFDQGLASLPSLARAASYLTTDVGVSADNRQGEPNQPTKFSQYIDKLEEVVEQTKTFADLEAGIGREDRLHQAQFELAKASGQLALQQKDKPAATEAFDKALDASKEWYDSQIKFYETGTASLRDVTQAWWSRAELNDLAQRAGLQPGTATLAETDTELSGLKKLVADKEDRQGRIAADVAYVQSLENLQGLWARQRAVIAIAAKQPKVVKPSTVRRTRIIEINGDTNSQPPKAGVSGATPVTTEKTPQSTVEIFRPQRKKK